MLIEVSKATMQEYVLKVTQISLCTSRPHRMVPPITREWVSSLQSLENSLQNTSALVQHHVVRQEIPQNYVCNGLVVGVFDVRAQLKHSTV